MLVELGVVEQRYRAVLEVLEEGASVTAAATPTATTAPTATATTLPRPS